MKPIGVKAKVLVAVWILSSPLLYFFLVVPAQQKLVPWLPDWIVTVHNIIRPWFSRPYLF